MASRTSTLARSALIVCRLERTLHDVHPDISPLPGTFTPGGPIELLRGLARPVAGWKCSILRSRLCRLTSMLMSGFSMFDSE
jgi:hypothetical protein